MRLTPHLWLRAWTAIVASGCAGLLAGCQPLPHHAAATWEEAPPKAAVAPCDNGLHRTPVPVEKNMMSLPEYVIEAPDILTIDAIKVIPKPPYKIEALDILQVTASGTRPEQPIAGNYSVDPGGAINLGAPYGWVHVAGMTLEEASREVEATLRRTLAAPKVSITLAASAGLQPIQGEHIVGPDGTVNLGIYGKVFVTGMTVPEARAAIEEHLKEFLDEPKVAVDIFAYNSKVYYVISEGAGFGDIVQAFPVTGNETVLDALGKVNGLTRYNSKKIWISRPAPDGVSCDQILPVNWYDITKGGATGTNYQILPGDRLFLAESPLIALNSTLNRILGPVETLFNFTLLGTNAIQNINNFPKGRGNNGL